MKDISKVLKNTREDLDLTQIDVMRKIGINNKTLSGYENGVSEPDLETFAKLIGLYGLSADEVLGIKKGEGATSVCLNFKEQQLVEYFRKLTDNQRSDLLTVLKALISE